jgi:hypothetical protein
MTRVPKKGLAAGGDSTVLGLGLGDAEADAALCGGGAVGLKALAFGLGRNEEALAFRCLVAVPGDMGGTAADGPVDAEGKSS